MMRNITIWLLFSGGLLFLLAGCRQAPAVPAPTNPPPRPTPTPIPSLFPNSCPDEDLTTPIYTYEIINVYPHDDQAFTQGLVYDPDTGTLYEGTGLYGQSSLRRVDLISGEPEQMTGLATNFFGEGITLYQDKIIQLTWQEQTGIVYNKETLLPEKQFTYTTEGWGITYTGADLIMSDGTASLAFLNPDTFALTQRIAVTDQGQPVRALNELEYIQGMVYANVWQTDLVAQISPRTGEVQKWLDLSGLLATQNVTQTVDVLNGIAFDPIEQRLFVTGKLWPYLFEIKIVC